MCGAMPPLPYMHSCQGVQLTRGANFPSSFTQHCSTSVFQRSNKTALHHWKNHPGKKTAVLLTSTFLYALMARILHKTREQKLHNRELNLVAKVHLSTHNIMSLTLVRIQHALAMCKGNIQYLPRILPILKHLFPPHNLTLHHENSNRLF
jgi:hypothetical protein